MKNIRDLRKKANMTQEPLAMEMEIDRSTVAKWETGAAIPRGDKLPLLAKKLGCSIDDLYAEETMQAQAVNG